MMSSLRAVRATNVQVEDAPEDAPDGLDDESVENLAEMLRQMQMNRMQIDAIKMTHDVLVETRDKLQV